MAGECTGKIEMVLDIIVGKWMPVIIFHIFQNNHLRLSELHQLIPDISKTMLIIQLRELEYHDIIKCKFNSQTSPRNGEYFITEYGKGILPLLISMNDWGMEHLKHLNKLYGE